MQFWYVSCLLKCRLALIICCFSNENLSCSFFYSTWSQIVFWMKALNSNDQIDAESLKLEENRGRPVKSTNVNIIHNQALLSGLAYCISSCSMILVNKFLLSSYDFNAGISLMLYQVTCHKRFLIYSPWEIAVFIHLNNSLR